MASHTSRFEIAITPQPPEKEEDATDASVAAGAVRREWVHATGETGSSGYPRYSSGNGIVADIDAQDRTVEAVSVDGAELPYGWTASVVNEEGPGAN